MIKRSIAIFVGLMATIVAVVVGCTAVMGAAVDDISNQNKSYTYSIEGSGSDVVVTYSTGELNTAQETGAKLPWTKVVEITGFGAPSLSAGNGIGDDGNLTCRVTDNETGQVVSENTSSGEFANVTC